MVAIHVQAKLLPLVLKVHLEEVLHVNLPGVIHYVPGVGVKEQLASM